MSSRDPITDYEIINRELANYSADLANRPQIVVATKIDALDDPEKLRRLEQKAIKDGRDFIAISAVTNRGIKELMELTWQKLQEAKAIEVSS